MQIPVPTDALRAEADQIRTKADADYSAVRLRSELTADAKRARIAVVFDGANKRMEELRASAGAASDEQRKAVTSAAWSLDDIAPTNAVDRAAAAMSYRDAQDRAAQIDNASTAISAMMDANAVGDELMARAVARIAYTLGWPEVVARYTQDRPKAQTALAALAALDRPQRVTAADLFWAVLPAPPELGGLQDFQVAQLAAATTGA